MPSTKLSHYPPAHSGASLKAGRKIDSEPQIDDLLVNNAIRIKYLERLFPARPAGRSSGSRIGVAGREQGEWVWALRIGFLLRYCII